MYSASDAIPPSHVISRTVKEVHVKEVKHFQGIGLKWFVSDFEFAPLFQSIIGEFIDPTKGIRMMPLPICSPSIIPQPR